MSPLRWMSLCLCLALGGCATLPVPEGFAPYRHTRDGAVSPDGVVFRVVTERNKPKADLAFWAEALKRRQENAGYLIVEEGPLGEGAAQGWMLEMEAPWGPADYTYLVAIFVDGRKLHIVEAAGEVKRFQARRAAILDAARSIGAP